MLNAVAAGHQPTTAYVTKVLDTVSTLVGAKVGVDALHSTIGRHAARAVRCAVMLDLLEANWEKLIDNIGKGDVATFNKPVSRRARSWASASMKRRAACSRTGP